MLLYIINRLLRALLIISKDRSSPFAVDMALEACNFEGLFLVRGRNDIDADVLIFALSKVVPSASVIAPKGRKRSLIKRFPTKLTERLVYLLQL